MCKRAGSLSSHPPIILCCHRAGQSHMPRRTCLSVPHTRTRVSTEKLRITPSAVWITYIGSSRIPCSRTQLSLELSGANTELYCSASGSGPHSRFGWRVSFMLSRWLSRGSTIIYGVGRLSRARSYDLCVARERERLRLSRIVYSLSHPCALRTRAFFGCVRA